MIANSHIRKFAVLVTGLIVLPLGDSVIPPARAGEPSAEYQASLRRTLELRKQRRSGARPQPLGVVVPYPMPPSLIIRQTPEVHDEIRDLLWLLRH